MPRQQRAERGVLSPDDLLPDVAEDRRFAGRQVGQPCLPGEIRHLAFGLQIGECGVDRGKQCRLACECDIAAIGADRIIIAGSGQARVAMRCAICRGW